MKRAEDLTQSDKTAFVHALFRGMDLSEAVECLGTTGTQLRRLRSEKSSVFDPVFARDVRKAMNSDGQRRAQKAFRRRIWKMVEEDPQAAEKIKRILRRTANEA